MKGIDISNHNGIIDFNQVMAAGIQAVIIKATEGVDYTDPLLEEHYKNASGTGLAIGFYHFMSEKTEPTQQAIDFYNAIKDKEYNIFPVLDIESNTYGRSKLGVTDRCIEFLEKFKELSGIDCIVYTYVSFANDYLDNRLAKYKCWIAHYGVDTPSSTLAWANNYVGHQYTDKGSVSGIRGNVDLNNFTDGILLSNTSVVSNVTSRTFESDSWIVSLQNECNAQGFSNQVVDGIPGPKTLAACPILREGAKGNITKLLQEKLRIIADGIFGINTREAVLAFQINNGLTPDGIVGQNTWSKLLGI